MSDYRIRFYGDLGNLQAFTSGIVGSASAIKSAFRSSAAAPIANLNVPGLNTSRLTTSIDAANRAVINSGKVYHQVVTGWIADMRRLDAASVSNARSGYGGITFKGPQGQPSVIGTTPTPVRGATPTRRPGSALADLRAIKQDIIDGSFKTMGGDLNKINSALKSLIPAAKELEAIEKRAEAWGYKSGGYRQTADMARAQQVQAQVAALKKLEAMETRGGGIAATYGPAGQILTPATLMPTRAEARAIQESRYFQAWKTTALGEDRAAMQTMRDASGRVSAQGTLTFDEAKELKYIQGLARPTATHTAAQSSMLQGALIETRGLTALRAEAAQTAAEIAKIDAYLERLDRTDARVQNRILARKAALEAKYAGQMGMLDTALATPTVPANLDYFLKNGGAFRRQFVQKMGIQAQYGTPAFAQELSDRNISQSFTASRDFAKGTYSLRGEAMDAKTGIMGPYSTTLNDQLKPIEKWNGAMRTSQSFMKSMVVDFRKVVEWTVATTAVFGILGVTISSFTKINDINSDLQRFQITAKTTGEETKRSFEQIAQVAYQTATPLREMTAVMDDIALATRRTNQTTEEWLKGQQKLAQAVGILTNLTGLDTAKATDVLTSAYKQLGQAPEDLIPMLNKLSAVAGGNAQAITDIATALGGLATAASAAGLSLDEQIASVQVLSQVTNKTAADTATAFKNLFGAINSPASEKMLKTFGIEIRDSAGNLRPFLDIYNDIYIAREKGIIQEGRYQDVLRAIAGGPRRAPDAAALLSNLPKIYEAIAISQGASNEALMANAKIMDTNKAKMQQMRTQFDAALVEKFTDAVNKLTDILTQLGKIATTAFGGIPSQLIAVAVQLGIVVTAALLLRKVFVMLGREMKAFRGDISNITNTSGVGSPPMRMITSLVGGTYSRYTPPPSSAAVPAGALLGAANWSRGFSQQQLRAITNNNGMLNVPIGMQSSYNPALSGIRGYYKSGPNAGLPYGVSSGRAVSLRNLPNLPYQTPAIKMLDQPVINAKALNITNAGAGNFRNAVGGAVASGLARITTGKAAMGVGAAAGIAGGLALNAAAGSDAAKLNNLSSIGMGIAPFLMMAGPVGAAAGVGLLGVSAALQGLSADAIKAEEATKKARTEVYDLSEAYLAQTKEVDFAKDAQKKAGEAYDTLARKTNRTTLENERLSQLQTEYASATVRVAAAQETLNAAQEKFLETLPKLGDKYQDLINLINNGGLTPEKAGKVSTNLAKDILMASGNFGAPETPIEDFFKPGASTGIWAPPGVNPNVYQRDMTQEIIDKTGKGDWKALADALTGRTGYLAPGYTSSRAELFSNASYALATASPEDQATQEYANAVALFGEFVAQFGDNTSRVSAAVSTYQAQVQAAGITKGLVGQDLTRATSKGILAARLEDIKGTLPPSFLVGGGRGRSSGANPDVASTDALIQGLVTGEKKSPMSVDQAMQAYSVYAKKMGVYDDLKKRDSLDKAAVDWYKDMGVEVEGLTDKVKGLKDEEAEINEIIERQKELRASIVSNYQSTAMDIGKQMLSLQAAYQGGDIKGPQYKGQMAELKQYLALSRQLTLATKDEAEPALNALGDALGRVTGMYGMQFTSVDQLTGAVIAWGQALGLAPAKIREVMVAVLEMNKQLILLQALKETELNIKIKISRETATLKEESDAVKNRGTGALAANAKAQADLEASIDRIIAKISAIGGTGDPNTWKSASGGSTAQTGALDIPQEWKDAGVNIKDYLNQAVANAKKYQSQIPGEAKKNATDLVAVMDDNKRILLQKGIGEEYLRKAIDALTEEIKKQNDLLSKADMVSRIRIGAGDFAALANVPINSASGISVGGEGNATAVNVNINGQILTPAQMDQLANHIAAALKPKLN